MLHCTFVRIDDAHLAVSLRPHAARPLGLLLAFAPCRGLRRSTNVACALPKARPALAARSAPFSAARRHSDFGEAPCELAYKRLCVLSMRECLLRGVLVRRRLVTHLDDFHAVLTHL